MPSPTPTCYGLEKKHWKLEIVEIPPPYYIYNLTIYNV